MDTNLLTYFLLLITVVLCWASSRLVGMTALALSSLIGLLLHRIEPIGLIWILSAGISIWITSDLAFPRWLRWMAMGIFLFMAIALSHHMLPGFDNLLVFDKIQFSFDSAPFTMYLNFDKTVVGILIYLFILKKREAVWHVWHNKDTLITINIFAVLIASMLPLALATHYVRLDPKLPPQTWLWALNNLFFVCVAEESLFRGLIQGGLMTFVPNIFRWKWLPLVVSSLLFGLDHYEGGLPYILLAAFAAVFCGYAYWKTNKIKSSIFVHFGLNLTHLLFFSYPSLIAVH
jgi:membrane protease YdiL (CAAX protease family)